MGLSDGLLGTDWHRLLRAEFATPYWTALERFVDQARASGVVYPSPQDAFAAFHATPYRLTRAVIVGQDPYHNGQAHGLCFSVREGKPPHSLRVILAELLDDVRVRATTTNLGAWAKHGVLLLNATLTVASGSPRSHVDEGWELFTDGVISRLDAKETPVAFNLWGDAAKSKWSLISDQHPVIDAPHPAAWGYAFRKSKPFSRTDEALECRGAARIVWDL